MRRWGSMNVDLGPVVVPNELDYAAAIDGEGGKRAESSKLKVRDRG
jgi:hypothetical protein